MEATANIVQKKCLEKIEQSKSFVSDIELRFKKAENRDNRISAFDFWKKLDEKRKKKYGF